MQAAGIQGVTISSDSSTIQFEHVWVEADVAYVGQHGDYRGNDLTSECVANPDLPQPQATCHWISLDPSFKQHGNTTSTLDPYTALSFDYNAYYGAIANQATDSSRLNKNPLEVYQEQILAWLNTSYPGMTLADIPDFQGIVAQGSDLLPDSLPYQVVGTPSGL